MLLCLLFQLLVHLLVSLNLSQCEEDKRSFIISSLERATLALDQDYNGINFDGLVGYFILQGIIPAQGFRKASSSYLKNAGF